MPTTGYQQRDATILVIRLAPAPPCAGTGKPLALYNIYSEAAASGFSSFSGAGLPDLHLASTNL
ncbi:hypothetical protein GCM10027098_19530 [Bowmanella dokdonensis]